MKYLDSYLNFLLESGGTDILKIVYSDKFESVLKNIDSFISRKLLEIARDSRHKYEQTLIDVTDKNDMISFIQSNRISNSKEYKDYLDAIVGSNLDRDPDSFIAAYKYNVPSDVYDKDSKFWKSSRNSMSIGKFTRKILKSVLDTKITDTQLEKFVNDYKLSYDEFFSEKKLELVSGEDIRKYYNENNYESDKGELGNSCMRQSRKSKYFDIYVKNPEVCQLLVLRSQKDENLIKGRALIWKLTDGSFYQDRIYTNNSYELKLFEEWAKERDMKLYNDNYYYIKVQLGEHEYDHYPYMDTFVCYNPSKKLLSADGDLWPGNGFIKLQDTTGGYESDSVVWSEVEGEYIEEEYASFVHISNNQEDWVYSSNVIDLGERGLWYIDSHDIRWCSYENEYFHKDDLVYSEYLNEHLFNYIEVKTRSGVDYIPSDLKNLYSIEIDGELYLRKDLIKDPENGEIIKSKKKLESFIRDIDIKNIDQAMSIIVNSYLNKEFKPDLIESELKSMGYKFFFSLEDTIVLLYINMYTGYLEKRHLSDSGFKQIKSIIIDELKVEFINPEEFINRLYSNWTETHKIISNFGYWLFEEEVYKAHLYLNFV
jgi:hypothetical protein